MGQKKLRKVNHIIIYLNGDLLLLKRTAQDSYELINQLETPAKQEPYQLIKTISHQAVLLSTILDNVLKNETSIEDGMKDLQELKHDVNTLKHNYTDKVRHEEAVINLILLKRARISNQF